MSQQVDWVPFGGTVIPPSPWTVPYYPWRKLTPTLQPAMPPILPAPQPFTKDEITALRALAQELIKDAEEECEQDELERLAAKYNYELTPKDTPDYTPA